MKYFSIIIFNYVDYSCYRGSVWSSLDWKTRLEDMYSNTWALMNLFFTHLMAITFYVLLKVINSNLVKNNSKYQDHLLSIYNDIYF